MCDFGGVHYQRFHCIEVSAIEGCPLSGVALYVSLSTVVLSI